MEHRPDIAEVEVLEASISAIMKRRRIDTQGRPAGFEIYAECDEPGCKNMIGRGVAAACGTKHGEDYYCCDRYFCFEHLYYYKDPHTKQVYCVCNECRKILALKLLIGDYDG